ncbi:unnamed protein product [Hymenolepis diminuta]|nr:unnamed protein product [Hymenolepis diminuta]
MRCCSNHREKLLHYTQRITDVHFRKLYLSGHEKPSDILELIRRLAPPIIMPMSFWKNLFFQCLSLKIQSYLTDKLSQYTIDQIAQMADIIDEKILRPPQNCLFITDWNSGITFIVDSGNALSFIQPTLCEWRKVKPTQCLGYLKVRKLIVYGLKDLVVDLGLKRVFQWKFVIANINFPVIGADFLTYFGLVVDFGRRKLVEKKIAPISYDAIKDENESVSVKCFAETVRKYIHIYEKPSDMLRLIQSLTSKEIFHDESWKRFLITPSLLPMVNEIFLSSRNTIEFAKKAEYLHKRFHTDSDHLLYIFDKLSGLIFIIDSGTEHSVIPPKSNTIVSPRPHTRLETSTGSLICKYSSKCLTVNLGLREKFSWNFIVADMNKSIIGADFLTYFGLSVDLSRRRLIRRRNK